MPPVLAADEVLIWKGRPGYPFRYPLLALLSFFGMFFILLGPVGEVVGVAFFFLLIISIALSVWSFVPYSRTRYYLTSRRVTTGKASLSLDQLATVRVKPTPWGGRGQVYFDSRDGRWVVFRRVKEPDQIRESTLNARQTLPAGPPPSVQCSYCGAHAPLGVIKCPNCGADL